MEKRLVVDPEKCVGCRLCETVCSFEHYKEFAPAKSRILLLKNEEIGLTVPIICRQCGTPPCAEACPVNAYYRDNKTNGMMINYKLCIGCRSCAEACPFGAVLIEPNEEKVIKCDLCGGDPQCVTYCPTHAIEYIRSNQIGLSKRKDVAEESMKLRKKILKQAENRKEK